MEAAQLQLPTAVRTDVIRFMSGSGARGHREHGTVIRHVRS